MRAAAFAALAAALLVPGLVAGPSLDAAVFVLVGWRMTDGALPYVDIWDHKPPGIYAVEWLGQTVAPFADPWVVSWVITVACVAGTGLVVAEIVRWATDRPRIAVVAGVLSIAGLSTYVVSLGGGLTEHVAVLPAAAALLVALRAARDRWWLATGALLGVAALVSLMAAPAALACLAVALAGVRAPLRLALATAGGAVVLGLAAGLLAVGGALGPALEAIVGYAAAYRATDAGPVSSILAWAALSLLLLVVPAAYGAISASGARASVARPAALAWLAGGVLAVVLTGRLYAHYLAPLAVPLAVLAGIGFASRGRLHARAPIVVGSVSAGVISLLAALFGGGQEFVAIRAANQAAERAGAEVRRLSEAGETLLVWGNQPATYLVAQRPPAVRFPYLLPLLTPGFVDAGMVDELAAALDARPPAVVVDAGSRAPGAAGDPPLLIDRPLLEEGRNLDLLDPLRDVVERRYRLGETVAGWPMYRLED